MFLILLFLLGLVLGSFINVLVIRLWSNESLSGRSFCRQCHKQLKWQHNIPVLSFIWLKGRCIFCRQPISWQYPIVEILTGLLMASAGVILGSQFTWLLLASLIITFYVVALVVFDWRYQVLPDVLTLSGAAVMLLINLWLGRPLISLLGGAGLAAGFFALQYYISKGSWIGAGDIRLGLWLGLSLGFKATAVALVLSYWSGALIGLILLTQKKWHMKSRLPFGVFLSLSTWVAWYWGNNLADWYIRYLGY